MRAKWVKKDKDRLRRDIGKEFLDVRVAQVGGQVEPCKTSDTTSIPARIPVG